MRNYTSESNTVHPASLIIILRYIILQIPGTLIFVGLLWWLNQRFSWSREWFWIGIGLWMIKEFGLYPVVWKSYAPASRIHGMIGEVCEVQTPLVPNGNVFVRGEVWKAEVLDRSTSIPEGSKVRVTAVQGLTLFVESL